MSSAMWDDAMWCVKKLAIGEANGLVLVDHQIFRRSNRR